MTDSPPAPTFIHSSPNVGIGREGTCFGILRLGGQAAPHLEAPRKQLGSPDRGLCHHGRPVSLHFSRPNVDGLPFGRPLSLGHFPPWLISADTRGKGGAGGCRGDALAEMPLVKPRAQLAFKNSMIRGILQFTLRIAFRCVLHRCKSQDIRC